MKFRTEIKNIDLPVDITHKDKLFLLGSCFAENIAEKLLRNKFETLFNPFGIVYNPVSISKIIDRVINLKYPLSEEFVMRDELWHHFDFHGDMSGQNINEVLDRIKRWIDFSREFIIKSNYIFLTFGTSIVYRRNDNDELVANNHKFPGDYFNKVRLEINEIVESISSSIDSIARINSKAKFILTISPVRHIKDGLIENQRSKAILQLAIEKLIDKTNVFYFPSYELLLDDLRDYRFYSSDLVHPSEEAMQYIWDFFSNTFFSKNTRRLNTQILKIVKSLEHKPFHENTESYKLFLSNLKKQITEFEMKNPEVSFGIE